MKGDEISGLASTYNILGLAGEAHEFSNLIIRRKTAIPGLSHNTKKHPTTTILAFESNSNIARAREFLKISDAVVLCQTSESTADQSVLFVSYHLFESLTFPSMMNIDLEDLRKIANGIGLAFNDGDDDGTRLISRLPKACYSAKAALLHFACTDDVKLKEIYNVSKAIALKRAEKYRPDELCSALEEKNQVRKVNVKIGVRVLDQTNAQRINLIAVLFGI